MINGPEQSNINWTLTDKNKPIWSYCEQGDNRGITIGIAGFTTKDGSADGIGRAFKGVPGAPDISTKTRLDKNSVATVCKFLSAHSTDPQLIQANMDAYIDNKKYKHAGYFRMVDDYIAKVPAGIITTPLQFLVMLDTSMNAGESKDDDCSTMMGLKELVDATKNIKSVDAWLTQFLQLREDHPACDQFGSDEKKNARGRFGAYTSLRKDKKFNLDIDSSLCKYVYCDGKCNGC
jgi:hypothetical protein